jgi:hypothetical protein
MGRSRQRRAERSLRLDDRCRVRWQRRGCLVGPLGRNWHGCPLLAEPHAFTRPDQRPTFAPRVRYRDVISCRRRDERHPPRSDTGVQLLVVEGELPIRRVRTSVWVADFTVFTWLSTRAEPGAAPRSCRGFRSRSGAARPGCSWWLRLGRGNAIRGTRARSVAVDDASVACEAADLKNALNIALHKEITHHSRIDGVRKHSVPQPMARARTGCSGARATRGLRRAGSARAGTPAAASSSRCVTGRTRNPLPVARRPKSACNVTAYQLRPYHAEPRSDGSPGATSAFATSAEIAQNDGVGGRER